jgi:hypothetical protein
LIVVVWFAYLSFVHPDRIKAAASNADQHVGVPPLDEDLQFHPPAGTAPLS